MQSPQSFQQLQFLSPQQQQLLLQAQQNLTAPSAADMDNRRLRMLLNNRNMVLGKDGQTNSLNDAIPNVGSPMQTPSPLMSRADSDLLMKVDCFNLPFGMILFLIFTLSLDCMYKIQIIALIFIRCNCSCPTFCSC